MKADQADEVACTVLVSRGRRHGAASCSTADYPE